MELGKRGLDIHSINGIIPPMTDFRSLIHDAMERQGVTQMALAALTGVRQHRISEYLAGKRDMTGENIAKLFDALGLEVSRVRKKR